MLFCLFVLISLFVSFLLLPSFSSFLHFFIYIYFNCFFKIPFCDAPHHTSYTYIHTPTIYNILSSAFSRYCIVLCFVFVFFISFLFLSPYFLFIFFLFSILFFSFLFFLSFLLLLLALLLVYAWNCMYSSIVVCLLIVLFWTNLSPNLHRILMKV